MIKLGLKLIMLHLNIEKMPKRGIIIENNIIATLIARTISVNKLNNVMTPIVAKAHIDTITKESKILTLLF